MIDSWMSIEKQRRAVALQIRLCKILPSTTNTKPQTPNLFSPNISSIYSLSVFRRNGKIFWYAKLELRAESSK